MNQLLDALQGKMANVSDFFFFFALLVVFAQVCSYLLSRSVHCCHVTDVTIMHGCLSSYTGSLTGAVDEVKGEGSVTSS